LNCNKAVIAIKAFLYPQPHPTCQLVNPILEGKDLPISKAKTDLMWTASFDKTALRVIPFDIDLARIWFKTGMTPGVKFDGISFKSLGPCIGSHLVISIWKLT
jgi:hypothetical protein